MTATRSDHGGVTLLEVLVVLVLFAVMAASTAYFARPRPGRRAATAARTLLVWARVQAAWTGRNVAVVEDPGGLAIRASGDVDPGAACASPQTLKRLRWRSYPGIHVERTLRNGIVWLSTGGALSCGGGGVISDRLIVADTRQRYGVVVSSLGRVRMEAMP